MLIINQVFINNFETFILFTAYICVENYLDIILLDL